jgi:SAM-dependent methyltransferase
MAQHDGSHPHSHDHQSDARLLEYREVESETLPTYWSDVLDWVGRAAEDNSPQRILDIGAGTGYASIALAKRFPRAEVVSLDVDAAALALVRTKAGKALVADRVVTLEADLDEVWPPDLARIDLTWASMSLHHLADPHRVLGALHATTAPGGLLAVAEAGDDLRLLPDDLGVGRPGLESRCLAAHAAELARTLPTLGTDWAPRVREAGFEVLDERTFPLDEDPPVLPATARYAELRLERARSGLAEQLDQDDLDTLDTLLDPGSPLYLGRRTDFTVHGSRVVTLATRSSS